jgi:hypothetical protein
MAKYLITYDLSAEQYRSDILQYLKGSIEVTESSYVADTSNSPAQISQRMRDIAHDQIHVYVFGLTGAYGGFGPQEVNQRLGV